MSRSVHALLSCGLALAAGGATASAQDPRDLAPHAKFSLRDAIGKALAAKPGRAVEAELALLTEGEKHQLVYEVGVLGEHLELFEVVLDAASGQVVSAEQEKDEDAASEAREFHRVLRHCELDLPALVAKGEEIAKGAAVAACLELDEGPECDLIFANTRYLIEMTLEARAGHLLEIELVADEPEEDEDEGNEEGDEEDGDEDEDGEDEDEGEEGGSSAKGKQKGSEEEEEGEEEGEEGEEDEGGGKGKKRMSEEEDEGDEEGEEKGKEEGGERSKIAQLFGAGVMPAPQGETGPSKTPLKSGARFSAKITHPYFPLSEIRQAELASEDERVVLEVQEQAKRIAGVDCTVFVEKSFDGEELKEISYNYFAQDAEGNVYYFGEDVDDYKDGKVVSHGGAWLVGRNATEPCLYFPAKLEVGFRFMRENAPPEIHEYDLIAAVGAKRRVPAGNFEDVVVVRESDELGSWGEIKFYARGVGLISENGELELASFKKAGGVD